MTHAYETHGNLLILCARERKKMLWVHPYVYGSVHFRLARLFVHLSPSHLVDDGGKVGRAVQLDSPQALEVGLEHAFDAHTVWVVRVWVLRETERRALDKRAIILQVFPSEEAGGQVALWCKPFTSLYVIYSFKKGLCASNKSRAHKCLKPFLFTTAALKAQVMKVQHAHRKHIWQLSCQRRRADLQARQHSSNRSVYLLLL